MEEISSKKVPVQHHRFQTGLHRVAEIVSLEFGAEIPWNADFTDVWIIFHRQGVQCYSVLITNDLMLFKPD